MKTRKRNLLISAVLLIIVAGASAFLFFKENGIGKYLKLKSELNQIDTEIKKSDERLKSLQAEIDSLRTNLDKIERVAREKFNMMKKNEKVFKIEEN
jgi:cell division protein FtsB